MSKNFSLVALAIVGVILSAGIAGSMLQNDWLLMMFIIGAASLVAAVCLFLGLQSRIAMAKFLYSKKEFNRLQKQQEQTWTLKSYRKHYFGCGSIFLIAGIGSLWWYSTSPSITTLLYGIGLSLSGAAQFVTGGAFRESDMHPDALTKKRQIERTHIALISIAPIVIIGMYVLPYVSAISGDPMLNTFGLIFVVFGIVMLPYSLWKVFSRMGR
jgi:hypothetical protein